MAESDPEEDDFGDIDWEDSQQPKEPSSSGDGQAGIIEISLDPPSNKEKRKRTAARKRLKEEDYQVALDYINAYVSSRLDHVVRLVHVCHDAYLGAMLQSLLPLP
ncbi:hypothetical protein EON65_57415, partial [archaeon]